MKNSLAFQTELEDKQVGAGSLVETNEEIRNQVTRRLRFPQGISSLSGESKNTGSSENMNKDTILSLNPLEKNISYVFLKHSPLIRIKTNSLQKWEGTVLEIGRDSFIARLHDLTSQQNPEEEAEFPLEEVSEEDKHLLTLGALFYWDIGYEDNCGQRKRISTIRFQRMPAWRVKDLEASKTKAAYIREKLGW